MLSIIEDEQRRIIDVRELIQKGHHPKGEILQYVKELPRGTIVEIHLPHRAEPLAAGFKSMGINPITNQIGIGHFRMLAIKLD